MADLKIGESKNSPEIIFDGSANKLEIRGKSYPPNPGIFFSPLFSLLETHLSMPTTSEFTVDIDLVYFNSGSSRILTELFARLEKASKRGKKICVNWMYYEEDEDNLEFGEEFGEDAEAMTFNLVCKDA